MRQQKDLMDIISTALDDEFDAIDFAIVVKKHFKFPWTFALKLIDVYIDIKRIEDLGEDKYRIIPYKK